MTAAALRKPKAPARYGPGADLLGCVVVSDDGERVILRCDCGAAFAPTREELDGDNILCCPACERSMAEFFEAERRASMPPRGRCATLLRAAAPFGDKPFHLSVLIVAAWRLDPRGFGLAGYETRHPDSNKVKAEVCHKRPGGFRRFVDKVRANTFRLNGLGLAAAKKLRGKP